MRPTTAYAPVDLLLSRELPPTTKVIWLVGNLAGSMDPAALEQRCNFSRPTVLKGLAQLQAAPKWSPFNLVPMPADLLEDHRVGAQAKILHGVLRLTPGFLSARGQFTYAELSQLTGGAINTVKRAILELKHTGWLVTDQPNQQAPIRFELLHPGDRHAARAERKINLAEYKGEAIMREYLNLLVASRDFEDDAAPGFLVNPLTDERLQLDRFYPTPAVAWEYNGPQHYDGTELFTDEEALQQRGRDLIKAGICLLKGIHLEVVHAEDLTLERMQEKVGSLLPLRDLRGQGALIDYLNRRSAQYRRKAGKRA